MNQDLVSILPVSRATDTLEAQIEAVPRDGNPTSRGGRVNDLHLLASSGPLIDAERVVFATGNARCVHSLAHRLGEGIGLVECMRPELVGVIERELGAHIELKPCGTASELGTTIVIDAFDLDLYFSEIVRELGTGCVKQIVVYNSTCSRARIFVSGANQRFNAQVTHVPMSEGLSILRFDTPVTKDIAPLLEELAWEAEWYPGRMPRGTDDGFEPNTTSNDWRSKDRPRRIKGAKGDSIARMVSLMCQIDEEAHESLPGMLDGLKSPSLKPSATAKQAGRAIVKMFACGGESEIVLRFVLGSLFDRLGKWASGMEAGASAPADLDVVNKLLYQARDILWWARNWNSGTNVLWRSVIEGRTPCDSLTPMAVKPLEEYLDYYWLIGQSSKGKQGDTTPSPMATRRRVRDAGQLNHTVRQAQATSLVGLLIGRLAARFPDEIIRWLDIGCGSGLIANGADIDEAILDRVEIVGLDFGESQIAYAKRNAARSRRFTTANGLKPPAELRDTRFHILTAFEFLEHVADPAELIGSYLEFDPCIVMAGSPLGEKNSWKPQKEHVWAFKRAGYEAIFRENGMDIAMSNEARVGTYTGGNDWLTVVATRNGFSL